MTSASAVAAPQKRISGELSRPGYTVIAVAETGKGKVARATRRSRRFSIRPPAARVTLHLRGPDGVYVGPIVADRSRNGRRTIVGVKAGTKLGLVRVHSRRGYGTLRRKLAERQLDRRRWARARGGIPIGAGKAGLVRSRVARRGAPPGDLDADGVANPLDIDDNGNLVLDRYERRPDARLAAAAQVAETFTFYVVVLAVNGRSVRARICGNNFEATGSWPQDAPTPVVGMSYRVVVANATDPNNATVLSASEPLERGCPAIAFVPSVRPSQLLTLKDTVNANAAAVTGAQLDEVLSRRGFLFIQGSARPDVRVELDCGGARAPGTPRGWSGGLSYCTMGGTGRAIRGLLPDTPPRSWPIAFPDAVDTNGNGFGELSGLTGGATSCPPPCVQSFLSPGATTAQIGTGDVLNWRVTMNGAESQFPIALPHVFATVPALVSYRDGAGNSGTVAYPVAPPFVGSAPDHVRESQPPYQGFPVAPCPAGAPAPCVAGDVVLTLQFWRPQRRAIAGAEQGDWTDIGGLVYAPGVSDPTLPAPANCDASHVSTSDPNLTALVPAGSMFHGFGFRDAAPDRRADAANTLSFSVNVSKCLRPPLSPDTTWNPGESVVVWLAAGAGAEASGATQQLLFTRK